MKINVLGLGESLKEFTPDGSLTIGVNDIHSKVKTDYVVCLDQASAFTKDRLKTIEQTSCKGFYSHIDHWKKLPNFQKIEFNSGRGTLHGLKNDKFCYSNNSTYVAVVLAFKLGAKQIILHGVDFQTHPHFHNNSLDRALLDFKNLYKALKMQGVEMFVGSSFSRLSEFIPLQQVACLENK